MKQVVALVSDLHQVMSGFELLMFAVCIVQSDMSQASECKVRGKPSQRVFWRPCSVVRRVVNMHQAKRIAVALSPLEVV